MSDLDVHTSMPPAVAAPDWQTVTDDVECVRCGYNLRGLAQPRCPECGLEFEWADLFDPARRRHPYLFEHQAQHGRFGAFFRTAVGALNPWRFWRTITIQQPCHGRRLWLYALIFVGLYELVAGGVSALVLAMPNIRGIIDWFTPFGGAPSLLAILLLPLMIQLATIAALLVFQQSLSRWRIRSYHVTRVCVYSAVGLYIGVGAMLFLCLAFLVNSRALFLVPRTSAVLSLGLGVFVVVATLTLLHWWVSLWFAYRRYLKIRRAVAMLVASQIIASLVVINVYVFAF